MVDLIEWLENFHYKQFVKENRQEAFKNAGRITIKYLQTPDYGHAWLCEKI